MWTCYFKTPARLKLCCRVWGMPMRVVVYFATISLTSLFAHLIFSAAHQLA